MAALGNQLVAKTSKNYCCEYCNYNTSRKYNYTLHLKSIKHKNNDSNNENNGFLAKTSKKYTCNICNKLFNDRAGLWRHKKTCIGTPISKELTVKETPNKNNELIEYLMKENKEMKELILEIVKNTSVSATNTTNNSHNTTNSHNKAFNLNFFLN